MKFFVIYRQNALFDQYVPLLLEGLPVAGTFTIPAGEAISSHQVKLQAVLQALPEGVTHFLTDETCALHSIPGLTVPGFPAPANKTVWLDTLFSKQVDKWNRGQTVSANLVWFAKQLLAGRTVKRVIVVREAIKDHRFVGTENPLQGPIPLQTWIGEQLGAGLDALHSITETLAEAIAAAGDDESAMIVADRHCGLKDVMKRDGNWYRSLSNWPHRAALLTLPFETAAAQLMGRGSFEHSFDLAAMREEIKVEVAALPK